MQCSRICSRARNSSSSPGTSRPARPGDVRAWSAGSSITRAFSLGWTVGDADEFFAHERSILNPARATVRAHQTHLKVFCDFLADAVYEWDPACIQGFGRSPARIITEFNRARHAQNNEQAPTKRPFTRAEPQGFLDLADLEVERVLASGRKGAVACRDATVFKTAYA